MSLHHQNFPCAVSSALPEQLGEEFRCAPKCGRGQGNYPCFAWLSGVFRDTIKYPHHAYWSSHGLKEGLLSIARQIFVDNDDTRLA